MFTLELNKTCTLGGDSEYFCPMGERISHSNKCDSFNFFNTVILINTVHDSPAKMAHPFNCGEVITKAVAFCWFTRHKCYSSVFSGTARTIKFLADICLYDFMSGKILPCNSKMVTIQMVWTIMRVWMGYND